MENNGQVLLQLSLTSCSVAQLCLKIQVVKIFYHHVLLNVKLRAYWLLFSDVGVVIFFLPVIILYAEGS